MFSIPQGNDDRLTEVYEGLPLVRLPDSAEEVEALLNAIYDPLYVTYLLVQAIILSQCISDSLKSPI